MLRRKAAWLAAGVLIFSLVSLRLQSVRLGYQLESARQQIKKQRQKNLYLKAELETLLSPGRLSTLARTKLGMQPPQPDSLVMLADEPQRTNPLFRFPLLSRLTGR